MDKKDSSEVRFNQKNKFINKIKNIDPEISLDSIEKGQGLGSSDKNKSLDKKERNKHSAKQSRDKKKLYIELMEQKQKKLQQELANKKKELAETKNYL